MPIGEFGSAPSLPEYETPFLSTPMYWFYEMSHAALDPARAFADATRLFYKNPANPYAHTTFGKSIAAACELFERSIRRYGRPEWNIDSVMVGGEFVMRDRHVLTMDEAEVLATAQSATVAAWRRLHERDPDIVVPEDLLRT